MAVPQDPQSSVFDAASDGIEDDRSVASLDAPPGREDQDSGCWGADDVDGVSLYLRKARLCRGLSEPEERRLSRSLSKALAETGQREQPSRKALVALRVGRSRLIEGNLWLVVAIARRYERLGLPLDDLIQEGNLGLIAAARRFERRRHGRFAPYAAGWIRQTLCRAVSQKSRTIRIPLRRLEMRRWAAQTEAHVEQRYRNDECRTGTHHHHTVADDAQEMGVDIEVLSSTIRLLPDMESLDTPPSSGGRPLRESLPDVASPDPVEVAATAEARRRLETALGHLPTRLRFIIRMHYGLVGGDAASLADIGHDLHITAERVRQLESKALGLLRRDLARGRGNSAALLGAR